MNGLATRYFIREVLQIHKEKSSEQVQRKGCGILHIHIFIMTIFVYQTVQT
jgi:hypothetical protein